ncbi:hypothetical protein OVA12_21365 [Pannonibacter sp. SL95]|nr:hypothetical protein [Pannonibacter sp. SL95]MCY1708559.1 hypothetical protein [Pannonibacter sp. SL95]
MSDLAKVRRDRANPPESRQARYSVKALLQRQLIGQCLVLAEFNNTENKDVFQVLCRNFTQDPDRVHRTGLPACAMTSMRRRARSSRCSSDDETPEPSCPLTNASDNNAAFAVSLMASSTRLSSWSGATSEETGIWISDDV